VDEPRISIHVDMALRDVLYPENEITLHQ